MIADDTVDPAAAQRPRSSEATDGDIDSRQRLYTRFVDWSTVASLATAAGTLILAVSTFAAVRSANRAARVAERSLLVGLRPVLAPARFQDPAEKVGFADGHWVLARGGHGVAEVTDSVIYLAVAVRNVGSGLAVLHGWSLRFDEMTADVRHGDPASFRRLTRDLYVPAGDNGFWQGALRDPSEPVFNATREVINDCRRLNIELLYGDHEGGQRTISLFSLTRPDFDSEWVASVGRHWNLDRPDPR
jgi:hypothetical protein